MILKVMSLITVVIVFSEKEIKISVVVGDQTCGGFTRMYTRYLRGHRDLLLHPYRSWSS